MDGELSTLVKLLGDLGLPIALAIYLLWRDTKSRAATDERFARSEDFQRSVLVGLVQESNKVTADNTAVLRRIERRLDGENGVAEHAARERRHPGA